MCLGCWESFSAFHLLISIFPFVFFAESLSLGFFLSLYFPSASGAAAAGQSHTFIMIGFFVAVCAFAYCTPAIVIFSIVSFRLHNKITQYFVDMDIWMNY